MFCLAEQISKAMQTGVNSAFMLITESYRRDNKTNTGCKMVTEEWRIFSSLSFGVHERGMISGGEPVQWGAIKDPSVLI